MQWIASGWELDGAVRLMSTPGHKPGHCSVVLNSRGKLDVITGDMIISPVQVAEPDRRKRGDSDPEPAIKMRTHFADQYCDRYVLILGSHFDTPSGVGIVGKNGGPRIV